MEAHTKDVYQRIRNGDRTAARELLSAHYKHVFSYLSRLCGSQQDAEDLTQQTFLKVWASFCSFDGRSKFSTWVHTIAYNTFLDWVRLERNSRAQTVPHDWRQGHTTGATDPFVTAVDRQIAAELYQKVDDFDDGKKQAVHLHYYQALSLRETAKVLGVSTATVKYRLRVAIAQLRKESERFRTERENCL